MVSSGERLFVEDPELLSVMAGGRTVGWTAENCVVLWRRILCSLGDINAIQDPFILSTVYGHLSDIMRSLFDMRRNLGVTTDNITTPAPPALIPPLSFMVSWLFQTLRLPAKFKSAKLTAMRMLCQVTVFRHDMELPLEHMSLFLRELHRTFAVAEPDQVSWETERVLEEFLNDEKHAVSHFVKKSRREKGEAPKKIFFLVADEMK